MRIATAVLAAAALASAAPALAAPPARSDQVKMDEDPYISEPQAKPASQPAPQEQTTPSHTRQFVAQFDDEGRKIANAPIPDTPENRARYGGPNSRAGQRTAPHGN